MIDISRRKTFATDLCRSAGDLALEYFNDRDNLVVDSKGAQDWVSEATASSEKSTGRALAQAASTGSLTPSTAPRISSMAYRHGLLFLPVSPKPGQKSVLSMNRTSPKLTWLSAEKGRF